MENCQTSAYQPTGLERTITVFRGNDSLGMTVSALKDGSGMTIHSMVKGGAVSKDGRLKVGDEIVALNGESTTDLTNAQARATLRRHSIAGPELKMTYVPSAFLDTHRAIQSKQKINSGHTAAIQSNQKYEIDSVTPEQSRTSQRTSITKCEPIPERDKVNGATSGKPWRERVEDQVEGPTSRDEGASAKPALQRSDHDACSQVRRVTLFKTKGKSLGISVIGGRGLGSRLSNGEMRRGIFVKHVAEDSPAARNNTLRPGDRILQVGGVDLSEFTHKEAVEAIRQAGDKVELLVQDPQLTGNSLLKTPLHSDQSPFREPSGPVSATTDGATTTNVFEKLSEPPEIAQHGEQGLLSYRGHMSQKYGSLSGELKMVKLDYSARPTGMGRGTTTAYVTAADGQFRTGEELLEAGTTGLEEDKQQRCSTKGWGANPPTPFVASADPDSPRDVLPAAHDVKLSQSLYAAKSSYCSSCSYRTDPMTCPIFPGCINTIDICKGHSVLGLTIVGGCNTTLGAIVIHEVNEGGAAHKDGRLRAGDHILEVNGIDLRMATHEEALSLLRLSPQHVRLCVYRPLSTHPHEDMWELFTVDLQLPPGREPGLSIVGKRNDTGIFVSAISKGGAAALDGRLMLGDQILSVNGQDTRAATPDYASTLLKNCLGSAALEVARFRAYPALPACASCVCSAHRTESGSREWDR